MKKIRVNKQYGEWFYEKEVDEWDATCYNYSLWGKDANGKEWFWSSVASYQEMLAFIKATDEDKERMLRY